METKIKEFLPHLTQVILKAGEIAIRSQKDIVNIGKHHEDVLAGESDDERIKQRAQAKTKIDEQVQELILSAIKEHLGTSGITIDAEEDTPAKKDFAATDFTLTIVIDPIDGTLEYTQGSDRYSIVVGFVQNGLVISAYIYYPAKKTLYSLESDHAMSVKTYDSSLKLLTEKAMDPPSNSKTKSLYVNNRVPQDIISNLEKNGYVVMRDVGEVLWDEALLKCITGDFGSCIYKSPQIRDVLFGAFIQNLSRGYMTDWEGNDINWPDGGRIPQVIFGFGNKLPTNSE